MLIEEHFFQLRSYYSAIPNDVWFDIKSEELCGVLFTSKRNVNLLLKKMEKENWISWTPGKGRGNQSKLLFSKGKDTLLIEAAKDKVKRSDLHGAYSILEEYGIEAEGKKQFTDWLEQQMGYRANEDEADIDILRFPFYRSIPHLDPAFVGRRTEAHMIKQIFDTLVLYNANTGKLEPNLAHYWKSDESSKIWTFYLRKGVRFHNGKRLTAVDVAFTLMRIKDPSTASPHRWMVKDIKKIVILHDYALEIELEKPHSLFASFLSTERLAIVPEDLAGKSDFSSHPIGTGSYSVEKNDDSILLLNAHDDYFKERAFIDKIEIWVWPDYSSENKQPPNLSEMKYLPLSLNAHVENNDFNELNNIENGCYYLVFNLQKNGILQDIHFRQSLHYALNREQMIIDLGGLRFKPASGFTPSQNGDNVLFEADYNTARELLKRSSYNGEIIHLYTYRMTSNELNAKWIKEQAENILGVHLQISILPIEELKMRDTMEKADIIISGEVFDENIEVGWLDMLQTGNSFIKNFQDSPLRNRVDEILFHALSVTESQERLRCFSEIENIYRDTFALLFLYHSRQSISHHNSLKGISLNALGWMNYKDLWFEQK